MIFSPVSGNNFASCSNRFNSFFSSKFFLTLGTILITLFPLSITDVIGLLKSVSNLGSFLGAKLSKTFKPSELITLAKDGKFSSPGSNGGEDGRGVGDQGNGGKGAEVSGPFPPPSPPELSLPLLNASNITLILESSPSPNSSFTCASIS